MDFIKPKIKNTTIEDAFGTAWKITANKGFKFYCLSNFPDEKPLNASAYSKYGYFPKSLNAEYIENDIVVVPESEIS